MELSDRKQKILQAIIDEYIGTAEPVGSRAISKKNELGLSSATIFAFVAFVGIILYFFCKDSTKKNVGMILL